MSKTLTFKNTLYNIIDSGDIGNGWKYVEVIDKKQAFSLPKCLYYKGKSMKNLLSYTDYVNHLDMGKDFINDFVKDIFRECYPGSKNPICKVKESLMVGGANISPKQIVMILDVLDTDEYKTNTSDDNIKTIYENTMKKQNKIPMDKKKQNAIISFIRKGNFQEGNYKIDDGYAVMIDNDLIERLNEVKEKLESQNAAKSNDDKLEGNEEAAAATKIQALYRGYKARTQLKKVNNNDQNQTKNGEETNISTYNNDNKVKKQVVATTDRVEDQIQKQKQDEGEEDNKVELPGYLDKLFDISGGGNTNLNSNTIVYFNIKNNLDVTDKLLHLNEKNTKLFENYLFEEAPNVDERSQALINLIKKIEIKINDKYYMLESKELKEEEEEEEEERRKKEDDERRNRDKKSTTKKKEELRKKEYSSGAPKILRIIQKLIVRDIIETRTKLGGEDYRKHARANKSHFLFYLVNLFEDNEKKKGRTLFRIEDKEVEKAAAKKKDQTTTVGDKTTIKEEKQGATPKIKKGTETENNEDDEAESGENSDDNTDANKVDKVNEGDIVDTNESKDRQ